MRSSVLLAAVLVVAAACEKKVETPAADTTKAAPPAAAAPAAFPMASVAGTWDYVAKSIPGDTVLVKAKLKVAADPAGWTLTLPGRKEQPLTVTVSGDSVLTKVGPYESVLRKGVQVTTDGVLRMQGDKLVGTTTAHYSTKSADSVKHLSVEATRAP